jgi:hypothetical protein
MAWLDASFYWRSIDGYYVHLKNTYGEYTNLLQSDIWNLISHVRHQDRGHLTRIQVLLDASFTDSPRIIRFKLEEITRSPISCLYARSN